MKLLTRFELRGVEQALQRAEISVEMRTVKTNAGKALVLKFPEGTAGDDNFFNSLASKTGWNSEVLKGLNPEFVKGESTEILLPEVQMSRRALVSGEAIPDFEQAVQATRYVAINTPRQDGTSRYQGDTLAREGYVIIQNGPTAQFDGGYKFMTFPRGSTTVDLTRTVEFLSDLRLVAADKTLKTSGTWRANQFLFALKPTRPATTNEAVG